MAVYRQIEITYWQDNFVLKLTPEEKFFYLYLLTNSKTKQCGIYELPLQIIQIETGYNRETVMKLIQRFIEHGKIKFDWENEEIFILNWVKHNPFDKNPNVRRCVEKELKDVKNKDLIPLDSPLQAPLKGIDNKNKKKNKNKEKEEEQLRSYWNATIGTPRLIELEFIEELLTKFGYEGAKGIVRNLAESGFKKVKTMRSALNDDGTIKPRETYGTNKQQNPGSVGSRLAYKPDPSKAKQRLEELKRLHGEGN